MKRTLIQSKEEEGDGEEDKGESERILEPTSATAVGTAATSAAVLPSLF